jgi:hypothetical protein
MKKMKKATIRKEETIKLFSDVQNPNHDIFVIPTQDGADQEDQWNGSIGDATMEHIYRMRHKMLEMESFVHMPNGNIFRIEQNVAPPDTDGSRNFNSQMIKVMTAPTGSQGGRNVTLEDKENVLQFLKDELADRQKANQEKEDALDQVLVPFSEWEANPQLTSSIDIPSTPVPLYIYAGNSNQMFYDWMPEDHPDLNKLNTFLSMANSIDWDAFNEKTINYFKGWLFNQKWNHPFAADRLFKLCNEIFISDTIAPSLLAEEALKDIETDWSAIVRFQVIDKFKTQDPIVQEISEFRDKLLTNKKTGKLSWAEIGKFGQQLYKKYNNTLNTAHWNLYKQLKKEFCPEIHIGNVDINTADMNSLRKVFAKKYQLELNSLLFDDKTSEDVSDKKIKYSSIDLL